ncbi:MAG: chemotaxis-specific protein-glutamate methyltransferase CheB [Nitrospirae bacterium]|nr:chemotaxis-specific protein-glutamate methyltransferase CheB [Nitrospirota bacterium]
MKKIRVLVVDDSTLARELIIAILSTDNEIQVIGEAKDGKEAVEKVRELRPDIVTMDIEMPVMDGIEAIEQIMASNAVPILVVTTRGDAHTAYAAILKGALDLVVKPDVNLSEAREFISKIKLLSGIRVITHISGKRKIQQVIDIPASVSTENISDKIVAIASSTGGPDALSVILPQLPENFPCPIVIAQHISDGFVSGMVEWLKLITRLNIKVAAEGDAVTVGSVYVSPSEKHTEINASKRISFVGRHPKDIYRPSCDVLLSSVARVYGKKALGVILTGMGSDGALGMQRIKKAGGNTIAQDDKTSVVFGMNKVAIDSGCIDKILPLGDISKKIVEIVSNFYGSESF